MRKGVRGQGNEHRMTILQPRLSGGELRNGVCIHELDEKIEGEKSTAAGRGEH